LNNKAAILLFHQRRLNENEIIYLLKKIALPTPPSTKLSRLKIASTLFQRDIFKSVDSRTEFAPLNANEPEPNANEFCREVPFMAKN
jgi:hypothetical protein